MITEPCQTCGGTWEHCENPPCPAILPEGQRDDAEAVWLVLRLFGITEHTSECAARDGTYQDDMSPYPCSCQHGPVIKAAEAWLRKKGAL